MTISKTERYRVRNIYGNAVTRAFPLARHIYGNAVPMKEYLWERRRRSHAFPLHYTPGDGMNELAAAFKPVVRM